MKKTILFTGLLIITLLIAGCGESIPTESKNYEVVEQKVEEQAPMESPLKLLDLNCEYGEYGWTYVKGRVENEGDREAKFVKLNIDLFNEDVWVDSDFTYIRNIDLPAGATDSFEKTWTEDITFTRCEAFIT